MAVDVTEKKLDTVEREKGRGKREKYMINPRFKS